jgi:hypothetical protein
MRTQGAAGALISTLVMFVLAGTGCGLMPEEPAHQPGARPPSPSDGPVPSNRASNPVTRAPTRPTATPVTTPASARTDLVAVSCNGRPSGTQVIALLRRGGVLPAQVQPTVKSGPLCAGTWQYTLLTVPDRDELHVVSRGAPDALTVVTAGTNPCTSRVRASAPQGILSLLRCDS